MIALISVLFSYVVADLAGIDISSPMGRVTAACFVNAGYNFAFVRVYTCGGDTDSGSITSYGSLRAAGMSHVGSYIFPCVGSDCPSGVDQVNAVHNFINDNSLNFDSFWLDIEDGSICPWDLSAARELYTSMIAQMKTLWGAARVGVYSDYYQWQNVFGDPSYDPGNSGLPMWYSNYDNAQNFDDWQPFGSWTTPKIKQHTGDATVCGFDVDLNWAPTWWSGSSPAPPPPPPACSPPQGQIACQYKGACGFCTKVTFCHDKPNRHAYGLGFCNQFGSSESCCVDASSQLIDGESAGLLLGSSLSSSSAGSPAPLGLIIGCAVGAIVVLIAVTALALFFVARRRRQATEAKISIDNMSYNTPEVSMKQDEPKNPTFY